MTRNDPSGKMQRRHLAEIDRGFGEVASMEVGAMRESTSRRSKDFVGRGSPDPARVRSEVSLIRSVLASADALEAGGRR
jgi:hypothetical protein